MHQSHLAVTTNCCNTYWRAQQTRCTICNFDITMLSRAYIWHWNLHQEIVQVWLSAMFVFCRFFEIDIDSDGHIVGLSWWWCVIQPSTLSWQISMLCNDSTKTQWLMYSLYNGWDTVSMSHCQWQFVTHLASCVLIEIQNKGHPLHGQIMVVSEISCVLGAYTNAATVQVCNRPPQWK